MSQVTTNLQIDFSEWVFAAWSTFLSFFLFFPLREEKQNNFTLTHSEMYCCVALLWWWEWEIAEGRGAGYQVILFHLVMQKDESFLFFLFIKRKRLQGFISRPLLKLRTLSCTTARRPRVTFNGPEYGCKQEYVRSRGADVVSRMQDSGFLWTASPW